MRIEIISTGDEIVTGLVVDTNAAWLSALLLRAVGSLGVAVAVEVYVPTTGLVAPLASVCVDAAGAAISGHTAADALMALPALALAGSLAVVLVRLWRASRGVQRLLRTAPQPTAVA